MLGERIAKHCADDGISPPGSLPVTGITLPGQARCASRRMLADEPKITVVIATRDRTDSLLRCLASVSRLNYRAFDVVVVDSAPASDLTARTLAGRQEWPFSLRYLRAARPGLALAHNEALPAVTGEIVAFTDDDVEVDAEWLSAFAEAFTETGAACVTGLILPAELETRAQLLVEQAGGFARGFTRRTFTRDMPDPEPLFPFTAGRFGSGANMAFRTDWLLSPRRFRSGHRRGDPGQGRRRPDRVPAHHRRRRDAGLRARARWCGTGIAGTTRECAARRSAMEWAWVPT